MPLTCYLKSFSFTRVHCFCQESHFYLKNISFELKLMQRKKTLQTLEGNLMHCFLGFMITCWGNCWNVGEKERKQAEKWRHFSAGRVSLLPNEHCWTSAMATEFLAECVCLFMYVYLLFAKYVSCLKGWLYIWWYLFLSVCAFISYMYVTLTLRYDSEGAA